MSASSRAARAALAAATALAERTADAYSADRYADWTKVAGEFLAAGYTERETEAIMRSKYMRWAADGSSQKYGSVSAKVALDFARQQLSKSALASLVAETFAL